MHSLLMNLFSWLSGTNSVNVGKITQEQYVSAVQPPLSFVTNVRTILASQSELLYTAQNKIDKEILITVQH